MGRSSTCELQNESAGRREVCVARLRERSGGGVTSRVIARAGGVVRRQARRACVFVLRNGRYEAVWCVCSVREWR
eukprot:4015116-Prymnesium_polylepis.1